MELKTLLFEKRDGVARVTLNRPDAANALDRTMARELMEVAIDCDEDAAVRCVVLTGSGSRMFCAGGDLRAFVEAGEHAPALVKDMTTHLHAAISRFARMNAPVIAAVNGTAAGGGFSLMCGCDLVIAAASASFTMAYTRAGLSPDGSSTFYLARVIGLRRAYEMALTNRVLSAAEALEWGLVNRVVADADLHREVDALAGAARRRCHGRVRRDQAVAARRRGGVAGDADGARKPRHRVDARACRRSGRGQGVSGEAQTNFQRPRLSGPATSNVRSARLQLPALADQYRSACVAQPGFDCAGGVTGPSEPGVRCRDQSAPDCVSSTRTRSSEPLMSNRSVSAGNCTGSDAANASR